MSAQLAVYAPQLGARSETFIRHMLTGIAPGDTVAVTHHVETPGDWRVDCPTLVLGSSGWSNLARRGLHRLTQFAAGGATADDELLLTLFLRRHRVRVALTNWLDLSLPLLDPIRRAGVRHFVHGHGYDVSRRWLEDPRYTDAYRRYRDVAGVIVVAEQSRRRLIEFGLPADKIHVVPCSVDVPERSPRDFSRPRENGTIRCLAVGRFVGKKAPVLLLEAFRRAAQRDERLRLDYFGDGPLLSAAVHFVTAFGLDGRVTLHGSAPNDVIARAMDAADIYVQHSVVDSVTGDEEGLPVTILEAMAHGLPVVSTRHAGIPDAVVHQATGLLTAEFDVDGTAIHILTLARDAELRARLGHAAWQRARDRFTWDRERTDLRRFLGIQ